MKINTVYINALLMYEYEYEFVYKYGFIHNESICVAVVQVNAVG